MEIMKTHQRLPKTILDSHIPEWQCLRSSDQVGACDCSPVQYADLCSRRNKIWCEKVHRQRDWDPGQLLGSQLQPLPHWCRARPMVGHWLWRDGDSFCREGGSVQPEGLLLRQDQECWDLARRRDSNDGRRKILRGATAGHFSRIRNPGTADCDSFAARMGEQVRSLFDHSDPSRKKQGSDPESEGGLCNWHFSKGPIER